MTYKSPIVYFGSKYRIIDDILRYCPKRIETIHDVFSGAFNVGPNIPAKVHVCNDIEPMMTNLITMFYETDGDILVEMIEHRIKEFDLKPLDKKTYNAFREQYNENPNALDLFVLHVFSFCHGIRFNANGKFNMPIGQGFFNPKMKQAVKDFCSYLKYMEIRFSNKDFHEYLTETDFGKDDLIYLDPPYLISDAPYNGIWDESKEKDLYECLNALNDKGIRFMLSNVLFHKSKRNELLDSFSKNYTVTHLDVKLYNSNYCNTNVSQATDTDEVIVCNYDISKKLPKKPRIF